jgi:hypothetical protein
VKILAPWLIVTLVTTTSALAQDGACRRLCAEFKVEPTVTVTNVFQRASLRFDDEPVRRERRKREFELILATDLSTPVSWLGFTIEAIFLPFDRESSPELEFETNFVWLQPARTAGWVSSHLDLVSKFSPAGRPSDRRAYTHKLNLELDTSVSIFNRLSPGRWLRGVELEASLDYVATGLPRAGDIVDGTRYVSRASPWSFSLVVVFPIAPM